MKAGVYQCPLCGKEYGKIDSVIEKVVTDFEITKRTIRGRHIQNTYLEKYYNIRICVNCYKKRVLIDNILSWIILAILPIVIIVLIALSNSEHKILNIAAFIVLGLPVLLGVKNIIKNIIYKKIDPDIAYKGDAIV